jgi:Uma2 family endonuclease
MTEWESESELDRKAKSLIDETWTDNNRLEVIDGEEVIQAMPTANHLKIQMQISQTLNRHFDTGNKKVDPEWLILITPDIIFSKMGENKNYLTPDIAGWKMSKLADGELEESGARILSIPDWVCEVASPSTSRYDTDEKAIIYALNEVGHYWIVQKEAKWLDILKLNKTTYDSINRVHLSLGSQTSFCGEPFHDVDIDFERILISVEKRKAKNKGVLRNPEK